MLTQAAQLGEGNTKSSPRARNWFITWNNPKDDDKIYFDTHIKECAKKAVWQIESGTSKTPHIQAVICYKNARTFKSMRKIMKNNHIEICKDINESINYCSKPEGRIEGPWYHGFPKKIKLINNLKPWQSELENIIKTEADDRSIYWIWESTGNVGKTSFAKYICSNYNALYCTGKSSDLKYLLTSYFENNECNKDDLTCIFDYTRSMEEYISYQGIEEIKNGIFCNTKYETKMIIFNSPHVFIFSNFAPQKNKLSLDRWKIGKIIDENIIWK